MKSEIYIDSDGLELTKTTWENGTVCYENKQGIVHRLDGPAVIDNYGYQAWYKDGKRHRLDGPAVIWKNSKEQYYLEGKEITRREIDLIWLRKQVGK